MTSSAYIAHVLDPVIDPMFVDEDLRFDKTFSHHDEVKQDYLRDFKRTSTYALDWAGDRLLIATKDSLLLYNPERSGHEERSWPGEWMSMQCDPNNSHIAAAVSWTGKFRVWDTREDRHSVYDVDLKKTSPMMKEFLALCWSPDSQHICINNRMDQIYLMDLRMQGSLRIGKSITMQQEANQMVWSNDGETLWVATGGTPGKIHVLPTPSLQSDNSTAITAHQYSTICLSADRTGKHIASGGGDCLVALWDPRHLICTRTFGFATQPVTTLDFNHTGSLLAWGTGGNGSSGGERNLTIVGTNTGLLYWQDTTSAPVQQVRWHPSKNVLAYSLNTSQLPEDDSVTGRRRISTRDLAVVHTLKVPES
jgi:WD40 repeat protein